MGAGSEVKDRMKAKMQMIIAVCMLCLVLVSCSSQKESLDSSDLAATTEEIVQTSKEEDTKEQLKEEKEYQAMLYIENDTYYEMTLKKGASVQTLSRNGYQFEGYYTDTDVAYVGADGEVLRGYYGVEQLKLYPKFLPLNYTITFFQNGREVGIPKLTCSYDKNLREVLPFGELLGEECIIGFQDRAGTVVIDADTEEFYLKDMQHLLDMEKREVDLEIKKTFTSFQDNRMDTYEVTDSGFFRQKLHIKGNAYDRFFMEEVDLQALKSLGYQSAKIELSCLIQEVSDGNQYIRVYAQKASSRNDEFLFESGKIEDMGQEEKLYTMEATVPIEKLENRELYVYYNAGGFGNDDWVSHGMTISVSFIK